MEAIGAGDLVGLAAGTDARGTEGDGFALANDGGGHTWDVVLLDDRRQQVGNVFRRRARGAKSVGGEPGYRKSDGKTDWQAFDHVSYSSVGLNTLSSNASSSW